MGCERGLSLLLFVLGCAAPNAQLIDHNSQPPGMVYIPAGYFRMGSAQRAGVMMMDAGVDEYPQQNVFLKAYWIDQYEVTVDQYRQFVQATGHPPPRIWGDLTYPKVLGTHPVIDVSWYGLHPGRPVFDGKCSAVGPHDRWPSIWLGPGSASGFA